jgi:hypothetical protein
MMSFSKSKGGDITMSGDQTVLKSQKFCYSADRKLSNCSNNSTDFMSSVHSNSGTKKSEMSYRQTMMARWHQSNSFIPEIDKQDIMNENPLCNNSLAPAHKNQVHPEFTQSSYLRLRAMEEAFPIKNYLKNYDPKQSNLR